MRGRIGHNSYLVSHTRHYLTYIPLYSHIYTIILLHINNLVSHTRRSITSHIYHNTLTYSIYHYTLAHKLAYSYMHSQTFLYFLSYSLTRIAILFYTHRNTLLYAPSSYDNICKRKIVCVKQNDIYVRV